MTIKDYDKVPPLPSGLKLEGGVDIPPVPKGLVLGDVKKKESGSYPLQSSGEGLQKVSEAFPLTYKREKEQMVADLRTPEQKTKAKGQAPLAAGFVQVQSPKKDETIKFEITDKEAEEKAANSFRSGEHSVEPNSQDPVAELASQINIKKYSYPDYKVARKKIEILNDNFFQSGEDAKTYLENNQDKPETNVTKKLAEKRYGEFKQVEDALAGSNSLEEAAINYAANSGNQQVKALLEHSGGTIGGVTDQSSAIPQAMKGELLLQFMTNKDLRQMAEKNPELNRSLKEDMYNFPNHYPEYAEKLLAEAIANRRDEKGENNSFANIVSKENTDKIVKELIEDGTLPGNYQFLYEKDGGIRSRLGTWRSIGRGIGNAIPGVNQLVNEAPIPTPGILENFEQGFENFQVGTAKSIANLPSMVGLPTVTDIFQPEGQQLFNVLKKQSETPQFEPSKLGQKMAMHGGSMASFVAGLAGGTSALRGSGMITNPTLANATMMVLATHGDTDEKAKALFPRNDFKQHVYIASMDGLNAAMGRFLPGQQISKLLSKGEGTVADILSKMVDGKISTSAAKNQIMEWFGSTAKSTLGGAEFMGAISAADDALTQVLEGKNLNLGQTLEAGWEGVKLGLISTPILGGFEASLKSNKGFRDQILDMAERSEYYKKAAEGESARDPEFNKIKDDVIKNLDYIGGVYRELEGTQMSTKDKQKYLLNSLTEKIKLNKAESATDPTIKKQYQQEAKDLNERKEAALNKIPEKQVIENQAFQKVKKLYDNEYIPDGDLMMLETESEAGKKTLDEKKVNGYLKFIAQQSNNIMDNGKFNNETDVRKSFVRPKSLIEAANEMFPEYQKIAAEADAAKESSSTPMEATTEGAAENVVPSTLKDVESTAKALVDANPSTAQYEKLTDLIPEEKFNREESEEVVSEEYHKAKADGSNPALVKAVEELLTPQQQTKANRGGDVVPSTLKEGAEQTVGSAARELNQVGADIGLDKPQRKDFAEGVEGDQPYADANGAHTKKVDDIIGNIKEEGTLIDRNGTEYDVEITSQGVTVRQKGQDYKSYYKGKRMVAETPFTNGFKFKPKESKQQTKPIEPVSETKETTTQVPDQTKATITEPSEPNKTGEGAGAGTPPISEPPKGGGVFAERPATELSHKGLQDVANEFSLPDVQTRETKSDVQLRQDARETVNDWAEKGQYGKNVEKLVVKAEDGEVLTDKERVILEGHLANVSQQLREIKDKNSPEFDAKLAEIKRLKDAGEKTRSEAGAALRIPIGGSRPKYITDFFVEEMDATGVEKLTEKQKETVVKEFEDLEKAKQDFDNYMAKKEADFAAKKAEAEFNKTKATSQKTKKTHDDFVSERKSLKDELAAAKKEHDDWLKGQGIQKSGFGSLTTKEAKVIAKIVKSYADEGITKLAEVVEKVLQEVKGVIPSIEERDIRDVISGAYNEKKKTRNQLAATLVDLRNEQKVLDKLENLERGIEPVSEKKKIQRNKELADLRKQVKDNDLTKLAQRKSRIKNDISEIEQQIKSGDFAPPQKKEPVRLDAEGHKLRDKLIKLRQQRDGRMMLLQRQNEGSRERALRLTAEIANIPRTLMTIGDFSGLLRQNLFFSVGHPMMTAKATPDMFRSFTNQKVYDRWFADLKESPRYEAIKDSKLAIADNLSHDLSKREEDFMSSLAEKIPVIGKTIVKGSERSYTMLLNKMRVDVFNYFADKMEARGLTPDNSPKQYKAMAEYINNATGRSDFGKTLNRIAPILNSVFFSPRLIASRVNMLTYWAQPRFWKTLPREARVDYFRNWASLLAVGGTILSLAKLGGADVEDDPTSSDFGKIKDGNTRWDIWGGAQPYVRTLSQIFSGKRKSTNTGKVYDLNGDDIFGETRGGVALDFFRNKLAPVPAAAVDMLSGRTSIGDRIIYEWGGAEDKEISIDQYVKERLLPMTVTGTQEAIKDRGWKALFDVGVPQIFGVGTQTYEKPIPKPSTKKESKPNKKTEKKQSKSN